MVKYCALLALLPALASAFLTPIPKPMVRGRNMRMQEASYKYASEPGGVKWFPDSPPYWDPVGFSEDATPEYFWRLQNGEIKNGRVAMLAAIHYLVQGLGFKFPFAFNGISTADIPPGLGAIKALPWFGWFQIFVVCGILEIITDPNAGNFIPGRTPGNVQPETPLFNAPGDETIRAKEINNGRLAMVSVLGMFAGEAVTGQQPLEVLKSTLGL